MAGIFGMIAMVIWAQPTPFDLQVRSEVKDKSFGKSDMKDAPVHGTVYEILAAEQNKSEGSLVRPVDATWLTGLAVQELNSHGYTRAARGGKPDILITILYGRGFLKNPFNDASTFATPGGGNGSDAPSYAITGVSNQLFRESGNGFVAKQQRAEQEKLFIRLTAWRYPTERNAKRKELWNTTMVMSDPDHADLNRIAPQMFAAGGNFLDHDMTQEEVELNKPLQQSHVTVGAPEVVDPDKPAPMHVEVQLFPQRPKKN